MAERRTPDPRRWRREVILVAALLLGVLALVRSGAQEESGEIRDLAESTRGAAIQNCDDLRAVEYNLIDALREDIKDDRALPASFFPDIPRAKFRQLIRENVRQDHKAISDLRPRRTCAERFAPPPD